MSFYQTEETRLRLVLGNALHHINALEISHGDDFDRDKANIIAIRTVIADALKDQPKPVNTKISQLSTWLIVVIHGICFACVLLGFLING